LLLVLAAAGGIFFTIRHVATRFEEGALPEVQTRTYGEIVENSGPPPGFRIALGTSFFSFPFVMFIPAEVEGSMEEALKKNPTVMAFLYRAPESASERADRDRLFATGSMPTVPAFLRMILPEEAKAELDSPQFRVGTIPGHEPPLRFAVGKQARRERTGNTEEAGEMAFVDLTPADLEDAVVQVMIFRTDGAEITDEFLVKFCENFRPLK